MSTHGNIVLFPANLEDPRGRAPVACAIEMLTLLEKHKFIVAEAVTNTSPSEDYSVTFEEYFEDAIPSVEDYAYMILEPESLTPALSELVYLVEGNGDEGDIELPFIEITVLRQAKDIVDFASGEKLGTTWCALEFSYEDVRLSMEIHRVRDENHPFLRDLEGLLGPPVQVGIVCY